jgi:hypothetical protein
MTAVMAPTNMTALHAVRVRRAVWVVLAVALALALAAPAVALWHAASSALAARACISPNTPRAGEVARVVVLLPDADDWAAVRGPWAQAVAEWDMANMTMGPRQLVVTDPTSGARVISLPLRVDMAGPWWVDLWLRAPGRPIWHTRLAFAVRPSGAPPALGAAATSVTSSAACGAERARVAV